MSKKVFIGLSGGVDSSLSALLLKEAGYNVTGVFLKNWSGDDYGIQSECPWEKDQKDAENVCKMIGIDFMSYNFEKEYRAKVVEYFFNEYKKGRTPNPDVMCNKEIKFKLFLEKAMLEGADFIATGHYAQIKNIENNRASLFKGSDPKKDQSYFLYTHNKDQLNKTLFPVGHLTKEKVRKMAEERNLPTAKKPDSQGICFIGEINVLKFLMSQIPTRKGEIIDIDSGKIVGKHNGVEFYTIGQRSGLKIGGSPLPYYLAKKDTANNILYVALGGNNPKLFSKTVVLEDLFLSVRKFNELEALKLSASVRYRQKPVSCKVLADNKSVKVIFDEPIKSPSSGQSLVLYSEDECLGGGIIK